MMYIISFKEYSVPTSFITQNFRALHFYLLITVSELTNFNVKPANNIFHSGKNSELRNQRRAEFRRVSNGIISTDLIMDLVINYRIV